MATPPPTSLNDHLGPPASPPRFPRAVTGWGGRIKVATIIVGVTASLGLLGWVTWWALTTSVSAPHFPLPGVIAVVISLLLLGGCLAVGRHPWLAGLLFLVGGTLVVAAWSAAPQPALLLAVSAGLAAWALLGGLADLPPVYRRARRWWSRPAGAVAGLDAHLGACCLICQVASAEADGFCADCGRWARTRPAEWMAVESLQPVSPTRPFSSTVQMYSAENEDGGAIPVS